MSKTKSVEEEIKQAGWRYLEHGDFIYYRAGRIDGRSGTGSLKCITEAIAYADTQRNINLMTATPEEIARYNVWTHIKQYLEFTKHKLPVSEDL